MEEKILYKEKCGDGPITPDTELCQNAMEYYNFIFTCCIISASAGVIILGIVEVSLGQFWTRIMCNSMTTIGLVIRVFPFLLLVEKKRGPTEI